MLYELVRDKLTPDPPDEPPGKTVPTEAELRQRSRDAGPTRPRAREGTAEWFRDDMLRLLDSGDETRKGGKGR